METYFKQNNGIMLVYQSRETYCKSRHISVNLIGIVVLSAGFVSEHRALDFKPVSDMKLKICDAENADFFRFFKN